MAFRLRIYGLFSFLIYTIPLSIPSKLKLNHNKALKSLPKKNLCV